MATTSNPYGLRPLNRVGGTAYAGATTQLPIASGYATESSTGTSLLLSLVERLKKWAQSELTLQPFTAGTIGVFMGCSYTDATQGVHSASVLAC